MLQEHTFISAKRKKQIPPPMMQVPTNGCGLKVPDLLSWPPNQALLMLSPTNTESDKFGNFCRVRFTHQNGERCGKTAFISKIAVMRETHPTHFM
jgi:hypothetical protein